MKDRLNVITESLNTAINAIVDLNRDLNATANAQKKSLLALLAEMTETRDNLRTLGKVCGDAGATLLDLNEFCVDVSDKVDDILFDFDNIPAGPYETFVGFCGNCGVELHDTNPDSYEIVDANEVLCIKCACEVAELDAAEDAAIEAELDAEDAILVQA